MVIEKDQLPIISLEKLEGEAEQQRLFEACRDYGFFYLVGHGIPDSLVEDTIRVTKNFFALPADLKGKYGQKNQPVHPNTCRGYVPLYGETLHHDQGPDPKEIFDFGIEKPPGDIPFTGPNLVPSEDEAPGFTQTHFKLQEEIMGKITPTLLKALALCLNLDEEFFLQHFKEPILIHRTIFYPAGYGFAGKHTDNGIFTVLIQEHFPSPSLRVFTKNSWIDAVCLKGAFVINLGDMLMKWTDGLFASTPHEVIHSVPKDRVSIPFFVYPQVGTKIKPLKGVGDEIDATEMMLDNFTSIWVKKTGGGRAQEIVHDIET